MGIKVGDIVQAKSGGPRMTVWKVEWDTAWCFWFQQDGKRQECDFPLETLKLIPG